MIPVQDMREAQRSRRVFGALRRRVFTSETLLIFRAPIRPIGITRPGVEVRYATHETIGDLAWFHTPCELEIFHRFLELGHVGYLAYVDGRCVHRTWLVPGPAEVREHWSQTRTITRGEAFVHYCLTVAEARGREVFPIVLSQVVKDTRDRATSMSILRDNISSQRAAVKAGWFPAEEVTFRLVGGIRRQKRRPVAVTRSIR